jgi:hypothetical protein
MESVTSVCCEKPQKTSQKERFHESQPQGNIRISSNSQPFSPCQRFLPSVDGTFFPSPTGLSKSDTK